MVGDVFYLCRSSFNNQDQSDKGILRDPLCLIQIFYIVDLSFTFSPCPLSGKGKRVKREGFTPSFTRTT